MKNIFLYLFIIGSGLLLSACFGGRTPDSSFYILSTGKDVSVVSQQKISVGVLPVKVPDFLDRPQIVLNETHTELSVSELNRWSEPLSQVTQRALTENLQKRFPNAYVQPKGYDDQTFQRLIHVSIIQMTGELGKEASLSVWWRIQNMNGKELYRARFDETIACGKTYADYVNAQNQLWSLLASRIAVQVSK